MLQRLPSQEQTIFINKELTRALSKKSTKDASRWLMRKRKKMSSEATARIMVDDAGVASFVDFKRNPTLVCFPHKLVQERTEYVQNKMIGMKAGTLGFSTSIWDR